MGDAPDVPGEWHLTDPAEPPAQLLRRAISHVESLLHRLEHPAGDPASETVPPPGTAPAPAEAAIPLSDRLEQGAPACDQSPTAASTVPLTSTGAQAEALRIMLHAQKEAHRIHAEADGLHAAAAADGERILEQARELSERLQVEAREQAAQLLAAAKRESAALLAAAEAEAGSLRDAARTDTDAADAMLADAAREVDRMRGEAIEAGRVEAAGLVQAEMATAVGGVREGVLALIDQLGQSLAAFDAAVAAIEEPPATGAGTHPAPRLHSVAGAHPTARPSADTSGGTETNSGEERRPLGLLFGAPRI